MKVEKLVCGMTVVKMGPNETQAMLRLMREAVVQRPAEMEDAIYSSIKAAAGMRQLQPHVAKWKNEEQLHQQRFDNLRAETQTAGAFLHQCETVPTPTRKKNIEVVFRMIDRVCEAFFPYEPGTNDPKTMLSYTLAEGHNTAVLEYALQGQKTLHEDYALLLLKLQQLYPDKNVRVLSRFPVKAQEIRAGKITGRYSIDKNADAVYTAASTPKGA